MWYGSDFASDDLRLLRAVANMLRTGSINSSISISCDPTAEALLSLIPPSSDGNPQLPRIEFNAYDWTVNSL
jgi:hypothetical protein